MLRSNTNDFSSGTHSFNKIGEIAISNAKFKILVQNVYTKVKLLMNMSYSVFSIKKYSEEQLKKTPSKEIKLIRKYKLLSHLPYDTIYSWSDYQLTQFHNKKECILTSLYNFLDAIKKLSLGNQNSFINDILFGGPMHHFIDMVPSKTKIGQHLEELFGEELFLSGERPLENKLGSKLGHFINNPTLSEDGGITSISIKTSSDNLGSQCNNAPTLNNASFFAVMHEIKFRIEILDKFFEPKCMDDTIFKKKISIVYSEVCKAIDDFRPYNFYITNFDRNEQEKIENKKYIDYLMRLSEKFSEKKSIDKSNPKPTEKLGEKLEDNPNERPSEKSSDKSTEKSGETPNERSSEKSNDKPNEIPSEKSNEKSNDKPNETPSEKSNERSGEKSNDKPNEKSNGTPSEKSSEIPSEKSNERSGEKSNDKQSNFSINKSSETPIERQNRVLIGKINEKLKEIYSVSSEVPNLDEHNIVHSLTEIKTCSDNSQTMWDNDSTKKKKKKNKKSKKISQDLVSLDVKKELNDEPNEDHQDEPNDEINNELNDEPNDELNDKPNDEFNDKPNNEPNDKTNNETNEEVNNKNLQFTKQDESSGIKNALQIIDSNGMNSNEDSDEIILLKPSVPNHNLIQEETDPDDLFVLSKRKGMRTQTQSFLQRETDKINNSDQEKNYCSQYSNLINDLDCELNDYDIKTPSTLSDSESNSDSSDSTNISIKNNNYHLATPEIPSIYSNSARTDSISSIGKTNDYYPYEKFLDPLDCMYSRKESSDEGYNYTRNLFNPQAVLKSRKTNTDNISRFNDYNQRFNKNESSGSNGSSDYRSNARFHEEKLDTQRRTNIAINGEAHLSPFQELMSEQQQSSKRMTSIYHTPSNTLANTQRKDLPNDSKSDEMMKIKQELNNFTLSHKQNYSTNNLTNNSFSGQANAQTNNLGSSGFNSTNFTSNNFQYDTGISQERKQKIVESQQIPLTTPQITTSLTNIRPDMMHLPDPKTLPPGYGILLDPVYKYLLVPINHSHSH